MNLTENQLNETLSNILAVLEQANTQSGGTQDGELEGIASKLEEIANTLKSIDQTLRDISNSEILSETLEGVSVL